MEAVGIIALLRLCRGGPVCAFCGRRVPPCVVHHCEQDGQWFEVRLSRWPTRDDRPTKRRLGDWSWLDYAYLAQPVTV